MRARGHLSAEVTQACVVTGDPVPAKIEEDFDLRFAPEPGDGAEEIELSDAECDTVFYSGNAIDPGRAAAETLALALDPFPRGPRAEAALREAGVDRRGGGRSFRRAGALKGRLKG
ncbi:MAG: YceD family protein [Sphingomonas sp.]